MPPNMKPPRLMSSQHPDNVCIPDFARHTVFDAEDELLEARFAFETLGCDEQMWDAEGKVAQADVLFNLFTQHADFFSRHILGKDLRLTYRLPNPRLEQTRTEDIKNLIAAIPQLTAEARALHSQAQAPIFEIILPQVESAEEVLQFKKKYCPDTLHIIPLFETIEQLSQCDLIVAKMLKKTNATTQRILLAKSDPALQSGMLAASLAVKIALQRLHKLEQKTNVHLYPIIGLGSAPFRGHFTPQTAEAIWHEYAGASTLTVQSSFKYDHPISEVQHALSRLKKLPHQIAQTVPELQLLALMKKLSVAYQSEIKKVLPLIKVLGKHIPQRRQRFGHGAAGAYLRTLPSEKSGQLPRAIGFTAALYSAGLPPELFGLSAITTQDQELLDTYYPHWRVDIAQAARYAHPNLVLGQKMLQQVNRLGINFSSPNTEHHGLSTKILHTLEHSPGKSVEHFVFQAAQLRNFLG